MIESLAHSCFHVFFLFFLDLASLVDSLVTILFDKKSSMYSATLPLYWESSMAAFANSKLVVGHVQQGYAATFYCCMLATGNNVFGNFRRRGIHHHHVKQWWQISENKKIGDKTFVCISTMTTNGKKLKKNCLYCDHDHYEYRRRAPQGIMFLKNTKKSSSHHSHHHLQSFGVWWKALGGEVISSKEK